MNVKSKRRWYQFSLKTPLLLFLAIGVVLATWRALPGERQRSAVRNVASVGGFVYYHPATGAVESQTLQFLRKWLPRDYFDKVRSVQFHLAPKCSDSYLISLREFPDLEDLTLEGTQITDVGLQSLNGLKKLKTLNLNGTKVTDVGLAELPALTSLQVLELKQTKVTNAGITHLKDLTELRLINLDLTDCTGHGADALQKALPKCHIDLGWP